MAPSRERREKKEKKRYICMYLVFGRGKKRMRNGRKDMSKEFAFALPHRGDLNVLLDKILRARSLIKKKEKYEKCTERCDTEIKQFNFYILHEYLLYEYFK